ncbi:hypothetical protein MAC_05054 [Metarhizium acridum CQMa 102]|uniref:DUF7582 domain-containing protein n=1 Tax=Metarhizium acridum (strain CQMa 102) TaxID=655827 RepID=E9E585_METAQ|nr:uncharacterized protein MAC_05054 [Metarhizium acridum CQMa 102]EFY88960.1 hypothetical protein MAC_05054 [Metarhizium acridum CQMa 102]
MTLKEQISPPLEAGPSVLDARRLPHHLTPALEYASSRLARKSLHLTLVVVRNDYQLPSVIPPLGSPGLSTPSTPASPPSSKFSFSTSPVAALKQLVRTGSRQNSEPAQSIGSKSAVSSPGTTSLDSPGPRSRWPLSPSTPLSPPPMTPCTPSSVATDYTGPMTPGVCGMRFIHASDLSAKHQRIQRAVFTKTAQKYSLGSSLSPAVDPSTCGLTAHLITDSLIQNEILFSSDGLTLLSLERLYSLKSALSSYSKTKAHFRLEDAVDELRRYILANNGEKVTKSDLLRSYDWLSVSPSALSDLDKMYRRAYGGPDEVGAISGLGPPSPTILPSSTSEPAIRSDEDEDEDYGFLTEYDDDPDLSPTQIGLAVTTFEMRKPPTPKGPILKIRTNFRAKPVLRSKPDCGDDDVEKEKKEDSDKKDEVGDGEEGGDMTARPLETAPQGGTLWATSIDNVLSAGVTSPDGDPACPVPMTPNGYDDISPITRGEWGFLMVNNAFRGGRTVAVETC